MENILHTERETRKFRLLALLLVAAGVYFEHEEVRVWPAIALAFFYLGYLSLGLFPLIRRIPTRHLPYTMLAFDTVFVSGTLYVFGVNSPAFVLMPILVVYYALYVDLSGSLVVATMLAFVYIGLSYALGADAILGRLLPMQIPLFYLLALFSGYSAQLRRRAQREHAELAVVLQAERGARAVLEMTAELAAIFDTEALLRQILSLAATATECSHATIRLVEGTDGELGRVAAILPEGSGGPGVEALAEPAEVERRSVAERTAFELIAPAPERIGAWAAVSPAYILVVSLLTDQRPVGVLTLVDEHSRTVLGTPQGQVMRSLAPFFAGFIATAQAFAAAQRQSLRASGELRGAVQQIERKQRLQHKDEVRVGPLLLKPALQQATLGDTRLELSAKEFDVLYVLARHAGQPVHHELLLREVWGDQKPTRSNLVDVAMNRLRRKLAEQAEAGTAIQTLRGAGYVLDPQNPALTGAAPNGKDGKETRGRRSARNQRGSLLIEQVIALAIVAVLVPALLSGLAVIINGASGYRDRSVNLQLAQSQLESVQQQSFQASPASYNQITAIPAGYAITVTTAEAQGYRYANGSAAAEVLQAITVAVGGREGDLTMQGYRFRP